MLLAFMVTVLVLALFATLFCLSAIGTALLRLNQLALDLEDCIEVAEENGDYAAAVAKQQSRITRKYLADEIAKVEGYKPTPKTEEEQILDRILHENQPTPNSGVCCESTEQA